MDEQFDTTRGGESSSTLFGYLFERTLVGVVYFSITHNNLDIYVLSFEGGTHRSLLWEVGTGEPFFNYGDRLLDDKWGMCQ